MLKVVSSENGGGRVLASDNGAGPYFDDFVDCSLLLSKFIVPFSTAQVYWRFLE
jgi:hypothetical protein